MPRAVALSLLLILPLAAGCLATTEDPVRPDSEAEAAPTRPPADDVGAKPTLRPDTVFEETEWGYVRKDWKAPATPAPAILTIDGYQGSSIPSPTHYLRGRDGALLALHVMPHDAPAAVEHDAPNFPGYTSVRASIRGTACSGGSFTLFDHAHSEDGYDTIEWLAAQPWATPDVGLYGLSYGGLSAFYVAATAPPHLAAVAANLLIDDYYRAIAYPGGVPNVAFPFAWPLLLRPSADLAGTGASLAAGDEICAHNQAEHTPSNPADHASVALATRPTDDSYYARHSLKAFAHLVRAPISIAHAWQDEQTGPRGGPQLFAALMPDPILVDGKPVVPKRLLATNGRHFVGATAAYDEDLRWFDHFLRGVDTGLLREPPVRLLFETRLVEFEERTDAGWSGFYPVLETSDPLLLDAFPASTTEWRRYHLRAGAKLSEEAPGGAEAPDEYVAGSPRHAWVFPARGTPGLDLRGTPGPDVLAYDTEPLAAPAVVAGPIAATLYVSSLATDTDFYVAVSDVWPDGSVTPLQRGLLRASHRAVDHDRSLHNEAGELVLPYHPHSNPQPVPSGAPVQYEIEVFPLAHVFPAGHRIRVEILTPPLTDGLWGYSPVRAPGTNRVFHDAERPSSVLFPLVPWTGALPEAECGRAEEYACIAPGGAPPLPPVIGRPIL